MRDRDDVPYIVIERESGGGVGSFLLGALLGIAVGFYGMFKRVGIIGNRRGEKR